MLILTAALAGCTTTEEIGRHEPVATYTSSKSVPALTECLATEIHRGLPSIIPGDTRTTLAWGTSIATGLLITLEPRQPGTLVTVRELRVYTAKHAVGRCL